MKEFWDGAGFMFVLFNPFLMSVYMVDFVRGLTLATFWRVMARAAIISGSVFLLFAFFGERLFTQVFHVRFESFLIFGGLIFLVIGGRFVLLGAGAMRGLRGEARHLSGSIAMPFMIGPGTVSASVLIGSRMDFPLAGLSILSGIALAIAALVAVKWVHDVVRLRHEALIERYLDLAGRASALFIGSFAVEMILTGVRGWWGG